ncbi:NADH-quinone oxidoreductase subunit D [Stappia sp. 28M-7]|nr:NADH-quinone oxidoreductase subunit D [Stappia sp. 28M-7]
MSMVELTEGQPRSSDGLQMDWIEVPFGPFFPGLPAGLRLTLTLDGDTVAASDARSLVCRAELVDGPQMTAGDFVERLAAMMPLGPVAYRTLACAAIEEAASADPGQDARRGRAAAVERERIASHLGWLADFGLQSGFLWLAARAGALQLAVQGADIDGIAAQAGAIRALIRRVETAPLMRMRLGGIAPIGKDTPASGPVDRARGGGSDARIDDPTLAALGFEMRLQEGGDALARFRLRCDEIAQSLDLIAAAGIIAMPQVRDVKTVSGEGAARIETPRGAAQLRVRLVDGKVVQADLDTPSTVNLALVETLTAQQELGDALTAVVSLDLSPWEIRG